MQGAFGEFDGKHIIVKDEAEASQIYGKGYFGFPQTGGSLQLDIIEAIYLAEVGKLTVRKGGTKLDMEKLYRIGNRMLDGFEIKYLVYRDMRQRGYVVKAGSKPLDFRALPRGGIPGKNPSKYWILAISERGMFALDEVIRVVKKVRKVKKTLLLAVVDEESDLTYYRAKMVKPHGKVSSEADFHIAKALFLMDRVMVLDPSEAQVLHSIEFFGKPIGEHLQLSLLETAHLMDRGLISVKNATTGRKMSHKKFMEAAVMVQPDFHLRLHIYNDLKAQGVLVKTGFKYGSHFRAYEGDPDEHHAKYLIHAFPEKFVGMWAEVSRAVRLAHGVKKEILLARNVKEDKAEYLRLKRIRP